MMTVKKKDKRNGSARLILLATTSREPDSVGETARAWPKTDGRGSRKGESETLMSPLQAAGEQNTPRCEYMTYYDGIAV